jgi:hypothetical protein
MNHHRGTKSTEVTEKSIDSGVCTHPSCFSSVTSVPSVPLW